MPVGYLATVPASYLEHGQASCVLKPPPVLPAPSIGTDLELLKVPYTTLVVNFEFQIHSGFWS